MYDLYPDGRYGCRVVHNPADSARTSRTAAQGRTRRAPDPTERLRDADRSRQRIVDAAITEFSQNGFAGARVRAIAERAGLNSQLITYYFGGKNGLYTEIMRRWHEREAQMERHVAQLELSFADLCDAYFQALRAQPELTRILVWDGLNRTTPVPVPPGDRGSEPPEVADLRRRQAAGEIANNLDPAYLLIALMGASIAPVTMPQQIEYLCGLAADSDEFAKTFAEQLRLILGRLSGGPRIPDLGTSGPE